MILLVAVNGFFLSRLIARVEKGLEKLENLAPQVRLQGKRISALKGHVQEIHYKVFKRSAGNGLDEEWDDSDADSE